MARVKKPAPNTRKASGQGHSRREHHARTPFFDKKVKLPKTTTSLPSSTSADAHIDSLIKLEEELQELLRRGGKGGFHMNEHVKKQLKDVISAFIAIVMQRPRVRCAPSVLRLALRIRSGALDGRLPCLVVFFRALAKVPTMVTADQRLRRIFSMQGAEAGAFVLAKSREALDNIDGYPLWAQKVGMDGCEDENMQNDASMLMDQDDTPTWFVRFAPEDGLEVARDGEIKTHHEGQGDLDGDMEMDDGCTGVEDLVVEMNNLELHD
ncbi:hypothetical protein M406DRAFT_67625 [Cryphonectria parasitica EP155]|uniref:Uncharacterized protein n=1 Tax=Cryphonectria parasitica (strain ATCC 38755 / EP155) TaxID=660469 RepID=A0A9P4YFJ5_CRYP1|nr:uncharacterized protein M406DRAFT_67625 [Cryphonectria parasitica EP155]KAF3771315.1 hypothetical protein M406DRAFT_67625 [Cryphonectria parasitica EP155]